MTLVAKRFVSWPSAMRASRSLSEVASIHSVASVRLGRQIPVDGGHAKVGVFRCVCRELDGGRGFEAKVHFDGDGAGQRVDECRRFEAAHVGDETLRQARGPGEGFEFLGEIAFDVGAQNFQARDGAALGLRRPVRAKSCEPARSRRRRRPRRFRRSTLDAWGRAACVRMARASASGNGGRRSCNSERSRAISVADDVGAGREELAGLDVGGAELGQRARETFAGTAVHLGFRSAENPA